MLDDIVNDLRKRAIRLTNARAMQAAQILTNAADEIERLRAEVERLQEVVPEYAKEVRGE